MSKTPHLTFIECMSHPDVFGDWFSGPSWDRWRVVVKAIFALPMTAEDLSVLKELTGLAEAPPELMREAWLIFGRRGGKDVMSAAIVTYLATIGAEMYGWRERLVRGERGVVQLLAVDRDQAAVCFNYIKAYFEKPVLAKMVKRVTADSIELKNDITIEVTTNDKRRVRGRTVCACVLDEVAHWRSENTANPDEDVYAAIQPATLTMPNALILGISSPYSRKGLLWRKYDEHYAKPGPVLIARAPTWVMNPTIAREHELIQRAYARDPADASAEYGAEFRNDIESFVSLDVVRSCVQVGVRERSFQSRHAYQCFVDVAAGSGADSYAIAIAHKEGDRVLIDAVREVKPPFSPNDITAEFARLVKTYRVRSVKGDKYAGDWVTEAWRQHGIHFRHSDWTKSQLYGDLLPLLNAGQIMLLDDDKSVNQIASLERRTKFGGRAESIDHPGRGHDDLANVIAGAAVHAWHSRCSANAPAGLEDASWRPAKRVFLSPGESYELSSPRRRSPADAAEVDTLKIPKTMVGPEGHYYSPHGGVSGDGRQKFVVCAADGSVLAFAWGEDEAREKTLIIVDGGAVTKCA